MPRKSELTVDNTMDRSENNLPIGQGSYDMNNSMNTRSMIIPSDTSVPRVCENGNNSSVGQNGMD